MALAILMTTTAAVPEVSAGNCSNTNYGVQVNTYAIARCDGSTYVATQYCHQQTGTGVGAGSGAVGAGPGSNPEAAAAAHGTAGTSCSQSPHNLTSTFARKLRGLTDDPPAPPEDPVVPDVPLPDLRGTVESLREDVDALQGRVEDTIERLTPEPDLDDVRHLLT